MEFPNLGEHCSEKTCKQLDFLSLKCDACEDVFRKDHFACDRHKCSCAYKKDVQVPVCPLCNTPIPVRKGERPDTVVTAPMDRDCKQDSTKQKQKIFTIKSFNPGCKKKEMMKLVCNQCYQNFCLKHRHPMDHGCQGQNRAISKAGYTALMRSLQSQKMVLDYQVLQNKYQTKC
nr:AN1-type zinc finger protein 2A-like [Anolis sagrei ordinatus]XP_060644295.1 AN1-type zinc finger protein 2A-like [Anolis sagrei ordinatus]